MKIAIFDIDDTITFETDFLKKYAPSFLRKNGFTAELADAEGYSLYEIYGLTKQLVCRGMSHEEANIKAVNITNKFWNEYFWKYNKTKVRQGVADVIHLLRQNGYEIHLVSLRGKSTTTKETGLNKLVRTCIVPRITKLMLKKNKIRYNKLALVQTKEDKLEYIKFYNPDIVFEDQVSVLNVISNDIKKICVLSNHNMNKTLPEGTICISDYKESINEFEAIIDKTIVSKTNKDIKTMLTDILQSVVKGIAKWHFMIKFKPIIYGRNNIPQNGSVIFAGNHRHKLDPVFISISSGKSIHWAALLRMFQGKECLFRSDSGKIGRELSAKFITAMGALPIARPADENYLKINLKTVKQLKDLLNMKSAVGFFPEGTINRKPEETNILPLKSDMIFHMAKKTDSYLQPFSIVWIPKEMGLKNRLIIRYSKPINPYNRSVEEIREIWQKAVDEGIQRSIEMINKNALR